MDAPLAKLDIAPVTLDPANLPEYALRTTLRMFAAIFASLVFTFVVATLAAKSRKAALVIVPALDILQSVPVLGFLTFYGVLHGRFCCPMNRRGDVTTWLARRTGGKCCARAISTDVTALSMAAVRALAGPAFWNQMMSTVVFVSRPSTSRCGGCRSVLRDRAEYVVGLASPPMRS